LVKMLPAITINRERMADMAGHRRRAGTGAGDYGDALSPRRRAYATGPSGLGAHARAAAAG
jgi:hypothetical protein